MRLSGHSVSDPGPPFTWARIVSWPLSCLKPPAPRGALGHLCCGRLPAETPGIGYFLRDLPRTVGPTPLPGTSAQRWESIPADIRQRLLSNVWCGQCRHETTITNFTGTLKAGKLLLVGQCAECRCDVARVVEGP